MLNILKAFFLFLLASLILLGVLTMVACLKASSDADDFIEKERTVKNEN